MVVGVAKSDEAPSSKGPIRSDRVLPIDRRFVREGVRIWGWDNEEGTQDRMDRGRGFDEPVIRFEGETFDD